jgi:hypothetical protein
MSAPGRLILWSVIFLAGFSCGFMLCLLMVGR